MKVMSGQVRSISDQGQDKSSHVKIRSRSGHIMSGDARIRSGQVKSCDVQVKVKDRYNRDRSIRSCQVMLGHII